MTPTTGLGADVAVERNDFRLDVGIDVPAGRTVAVLGPNGAGKSTFLRAVAGLIPSTGTVIVDGADVSTLLPERRPMAVVFQELRLFPHLSALDNVAFALRCRGTRRAAATTEAREWLDRIGVGAQASQRPATLSGGQAQRVALARALASRPRVLLLDEPLSALDATTRASTRRELRRHLDEYHGARVVVTHDPIEAMALADELVIVEAGRVVQRGCLADLAAAPATTYVADLVGVNRFEGNGRDDHVELDSGAAIVAAGAGAGRVIAVVHPRSVALHIKAPEGSPRNVWRGTVATVEPGLNSTVRASVHGPVPLVVEVTAAAARDLELVPGREVWLSVKATEVHVAPA